MHLMFITVGKDDRQHCEYICYDLLLIAHYIPFELAII